MAKIQFLFESDSELEILINSELDLVKYAFDDFYWVEILNQPLSVKEASNYNKEELVRNYETPLDMKVLFNLGYKEYLKNKDDIEVLEFARVCKESAIVQNKINTIENVIKDFIDETNENYINELKDNYQELKDMESEDELVINLRSSVSFYDEENYIVPFIEYFNIDLGSFYPIYSEEEFKDKLLDEIRE